MSLIQKTPFYINTLKAKKHLQSLGVEPNVVAIRHDEYYRMFKSMPPCITPTIHGMVIKQDDNIPDGCMFIVRKENLPSD